MTGLTRRDILFGSSAVVASGLGGCSPPPSPTMEIQRPDGVPVGPFGAESTAEEVTAGMDLTGKTAVITGCNSGLGYETMRVLALRGAHVFGIARTMEKAADACNSVDGEATPFAGDLEKFDEMAACAEAIAATGTPIDMMICNAAVMALPELQQVHGLERQFVVNYLGHFILAHRLLEQVKAAPQGRFVIVTSPTYRLMPDGIQFDHLDGTWGPYIPFQMYGHSKLAIGLMSLELSRRLKDTPATSNSLHPGVINTNLGRYFPLKDRIRAALLGWSYMKSHGQGAATHAYVATSPLINGVTGRYFEDCNPVLPGFQMENTEMAQRLWTVSENLTRPYLDAAEAGEQT